MVESATTAAQLTRLACLCLLVNMNRVNFLQEDVFEYGMFLDLLIMPQDNSRWYRATSCG